MQDVGLPGGGQVALTTAESYIDLSAFAGRVVRLWSADGDVWFSFAPDGTAAGSLVTAGAQAPSLTALVSSRAGKGRALPRRVRNGHTVLVAKMVTGTGTLKIKIASDVAGDSSDEAEDVLSPDVVTATISGTVTTTTAPAAAVRTDNTTYVAAGDMSADVQGAAITTGPEGQLFVSCSWSNTGSPVGFFWLQGLGIDGTTWGDIPGSAAAFGPAGSAGTGHPNNDTSSSRGHAFNLRVYAQVRVLYRRSSGGATNTTLVIRTRTL